jgi:hypothetical protein
MYLDRGLKMADHLLNRRAFGSILSGGLAATLLRDTAMQEFRVSGNLGAERLRDLLVYLGHPAKDAAELEQFRPVVEDALRAIQVIRDFEIPLDLEPAFAFSAER